jgi:Arc/MetJ-type ribon-helix-helix transcriptional regulator
MSREAHVRFSEGAGARFPRATRLPAGRPSFAILRKVTAAAWALRSLVPGTWGRPVLDHPLKIARGPPDTIRTPSTWKYRSLPDTVRELRPKAPDTEKITINLGYVDLGRVDLMVQEGFYSNRTDFIRTAIRNQLERHADVVKQSTVRQSLDLGLRTYRRMDLEAARRAGEMLHINVLGLATIDQDVTPDLARETIASVSVLGALHATPAVKAALADRTR